MPYFLPASQSKKPPLRGVNACRRRYPAFRLPIYKKLGALPGRYGFTEAEIGREKRYMGKSVRTPQNGPGKAETREEPPWRGCETESSISHQKTREPHLVPYRRGHHARGGAVVSGILSRLYAVLIQRAALLYFL